MAEYVKANPSVTDVLFTGGDPMVMSTQNLRAYMEPLLPTHPAAPRNLKTIRIGTKALAWWPRRFLDGEEAKALLSLCEEVVDAGLHLSIQAHFSHPRELHDSGTQAAIRALRSTGAVIRCQAPLM